MKQCIRCQEPGIWCSSCEQQLARVPSPCARCGEPLSMGACDVCAKHDFAFDSVLAPFLYQKPLDTIIWQLKYQARLYTLPALGALIHPLPKPSVLPQCIIPVPIASNRLALRGFNQAHELAKYFATWSGCPLEAHMLERTTHGASQITRKRSARFLRTRAYQFRVLKPLPEHIAVVDDVITTGATASAIAKCLKQHGVKRVDIWALCKTPKRPKKA